MKILRAARFITKALGRRPEPMAGAPDPLDHPDLRRLSPRELADLPLPRPLLAEGLRLR